MAGDWSGFTENLVFPHSEARRNWVAYFSGEKGGISPADWRVDRSH